MADNIGGGVGEHVSTRDEAPPDESGMSAGDAAASAYDDHDRVHNGIAEGERESFGQYLKGHADHVGVGVTEGVGVLVDTAVVLRNGSQDQKRQMIGHMIDNHDIRPETTAESPQAVEYVTPGPETGKSSKMWARRTWLFRILLQQIR